MSEFAVKLEEARRRLPLLELMGQYGVERPRGDGSWKKCPFCGHEGSAGLFTPKGKSFKKFKCHFTSCPTGCEALDEIKFLAFKANLNEKEAAKQYLKMAGVWKDRESHAPSVMPGQRARRIAEPAGHWRDGQSPDGAGNADGEGELAQRRRDAERLGKMVCPECGEGEMVWNGAAYFCKAKCRGKWEVGGLEGLKEGDPSPWPSPLGGERGCALEGISNNFSAGQSHDVASSEARGSTMAVSGGAEVSPGAVMEISEVVEPGAKVHAAKGVPANASPEGLYQSAGEAANFGGGDSPRSHEGHEEGEGEGDLTEGNERSECGGGTPHPSPLPSEGRGDGTPVSNRRSRADGDGVVVPSDELLEAVKVLAGEGGVTVERLAGRLGLNRASAENVFKYLVLLGVVDQGGRTPHPGPLPSEGRGEGGPVENRRSNERGEDNFLAAAGDGESGGSPAVSSGGGSPGDLGDGQSVPPARDGGEKRQGTGAVQDVGAREGGDGGKVVRSSGGDGGGGGSDGPFGDEGEDVPAPLRALRVFYGRLTLTDEDKGKLWVKRGLTGETCELAGLRSNVPANKSILEAMVANEEFAPATMVEAGLWMEDADGERKPSKFFCGYGIKGYRRTEEGKKAEYDWVQPVLIPYFDSNGALVKLRPHKGGIKGEPPRLYVARRGGVASGGAAGPAVITEGEFKALALWQAFGWRHAVGALPGITMAKTLFGDVEDWLSEELEGTTKRVVVAYDNEDKGTEGLPGYKKEKHKRFDVQIWSRYLARALGKEGYEARVAVLPDEWRDKEGKADWDGACAMLVKRFSSELLIKGNAETTWLEVGPKVNREFSRVLQGAVEEREFRQAQLFGTEEERIIQNGVERLCYDWKLPVGGEKEEVTARRILRFLGKLKKGDDRVSNYARMQLYKVAKEYQDLRGGYYLLRDWNEKLGGMWGGEMAKAQRNGDVEYRRLLEIVLKGMPKRVSDFYMEVPYALSRVDRKMVRLVVLRNIHGESTERKGLVELMASDFAQPSKFREFLLNQGGFTWKAGERELNDLQADIAYLTAHKMVNEVTVRGEHPESKLWFFEDCAWTPGGDVLRPDRSGIYWWNGQGYKLSDYDHEKQEFCHGLPLMRPDEPEANLGTVFPEVARKLYATVGYEGFLALGMVVACAASKEIYREYSCFPGLWVHGEMGSGKSSLVRWLFRVWGYDRDSGLPLGGSTKVGLAIALQQYGSMPVWFEEFQPDSAKWLIEMLKFVFDRASGIKKTMDDSTRDILGTAIVTGVSRATDAQILSRYAHVHVSKSKRLEEHFEWFQDESQKFWQFGRFVLKHRAVFARKVLEWLKLWEKSKELAHMERRVRIVYGVGYAAFMALVQLVQEHYGEGFDYPTYNDLGFYKQALIDHSLTSVGEVRSQVNVNQFWSDLCAAVKSNAFGDSPAELKRVFKVVRTEMLNPPGSPQQTRDGMVMWESVKLYFVPGPVIDMLRRYKRAQGRDVPLDLNDLHGQMRTRPYFLRGRDSDKGRMRLRFAGSSLETCWGIDLDQHELGYMPVSDEEFEASFYRDEVARAQGISLPRGEWLDPRKGDLYAVVDMIEGRKREEVSGEEKVAA